MILHDNLTAYFTSLRVFRAEALSDIQFVKYIVNRVRRDSTTLSIQETLQRFFSSSILSEYEFSLCEKKVEENYKIEAFLLLVSLASMPIPKKYGMHGRTVFLDTFFKRQEANLINFIHDMAEGTNFSLESLHYLVALMFGLVEEKLISQDLKECASFFRDAMVFSNFLNSCDGISARCVQSLCIKALYQFVGIIAYEQKKILDREKKVEESLKKSNLNFETNLARLHKFFFDFFLTPEIPFEVMRQWCQKRFHYREELKYLKHLAALPKPETNLTEFALLDNENEDVAGFMEVEKSYLDSFTENQTLEALETGSASSFDEEKVQKFKN